MSTVKPTAQKKIAFKISLLVDNAPGHSRALMEMDSEIYVVSGLLTHHPLCSLLMKESFQPSSLLI